MEIFNVIFFPISASSSWWSSRSILLIFLLALSLSSATPLYPPHSSSSSSSSSSPLFMSTTQHRQAKPKWVNPCGIDRNAMGHLSHALYGQHFPVRPLSDVELMENIILAAKNALRHTRVFKEDYVSSIGFFLLFC